MKSGVMLFCILITLTAAAQSPAAKSSMNMKNYSTDSAAIAAALERAYFKGIYEGDIELLKTIYYDNTLLFGDVKGEPYYKTLAGYLDGVANRQSPKDS